MVDEIIASNSEILIKERKYKSPSSFPHFGRPFIDNLVQARAYCFCLDYMLNFMSTPVLPIRYEVIYESSDESGESLSFPSCQFDSSEKSCNSKELDFVLEYWTNKREAIPTKNNRKCLSCEYRTICDR